MPHRWMPPETSSRWPLTCVLSRTVTVAMPGALTVNGTIADEGAALATLMVPRLG